MIPIGTVIKVLRINEDLTQAAFGEKLGITANYVSLIEKGHREPSLTLLARMADTFKFSKPLEITYVQGAWFAKGKLHTLFEDHYTARHKERLKKRLGAKYNPVLNQW
jgi:transcriptional regulator with XRE-family HTH domain